jgi:hypothetical protein
MRAPGSVWPEFRTRFHYTALNRSVELGRVGCFAPKEPFWQASRAPRKPGTKPAFIACWEGLVKRRYWLSCGLLLPKSLPSGARPNGSETHPHTILSPRHPVPKQSVPTPSRPHTSIADSCPECPVEPATLWIFVVSSASSKVKGGRNGGHGLASMVLPEPGGPIIRMLWPAGAGQGALGGVLAAHVLEVHRIVLGFAEQRVAVDLQRENPHCRYSRRG